MAAKLLGIDGVEWTRPGQPFIPGFLEERFQDQLQEYWPYLHGDPTFEYWNTLGALPRLPPPRVDAALLARLIRFAVADGWGRPARKKLRQMPRSNVPITSNSFCRMWPGGRCWPTCLSKRPLA